MFYPRLTNPKKEREINEGRKRIDIVFDNAATSGFFHKIHDIDKIASRYIFVECKNYSEDPKNPELDQLSGRFSVNSGLFGLLVCRDINNKKLFLKRCSDLWKQKQELIIPLTDMELVSMLKETINKDTNPGEIALSNLKRDVLLH